MKLEKTKYEHKRNNEPADDLNDVVKYNYKENESINCKL